jgi:DtxR family transcriptional regulator, Mn-dependent transcriptional regulator
LKISENAQERLEQLWIVFEEKEDKEVNAFSSSEETDQELAESGLIKRQRGEVVLTEIGRKEAAQAIRRHRLAERLLTDVLTTEEALVDDRACGLEHALFDGVDESICTLLGHPQFCPHGKPIPAGDCCRQMRSTIQRLIAPMCELKPGQAGKIAYIQMKDPQRLQKLMAMGVLPGVSVHITRDFPSFVFEAGYSQFAVDTDIAADIFVRIEK